MLAAQFTNSPVWWQFLSASKDSFASLESLVKIVAVLAAGSWAIFHFARKREAYPRANLRHTIEVLDYSKSEWLVRVNLNIKNDSVVLMRIFEGHTWVQQMEPWPEDMIAAFKQTCKVPEKAAPEAPWPLIHEKLLNGEKELEPGEFDEVSMDFFINKAYEKVLLYSFIKNYAKPGRNLGWSVSNILDFTKPAKAWSDQIQGQTLEKPRPQEAGKI